MRKWISIVAACRQPGTDHQSSGKQSREKYHVVDRSNGFDEILLSQKWIGVPKGGVIDVGGDKRMFPYDMASLEIEVRIVNPSGRPIDVTTAYQLRDSQDNRIGDFVSASPPTSSWEGVGSGLTRAEELNGWSMIGPNSQRDISLVTPLHNASDFRGKGPLYVHQMGRDPNGKMTIPEANITILKWGAPAISAERAAAQSTLVSPGEYIGKDRYGNEIDVVFVIVNDETKIAKMIITFGSDRQYPLSFGSTYAEVSHWWSSTGDKYHSDPPFGINKDGNIEFVLMLMNTEDPKQTKWSSLSGHVKKAPKSLWGVVFGKPKEEFILSLARPKPGDAPVGLPETAIEIISPKVDQNLRDEYEFVLNPKNPINIGVKD
jgi:hypothetical protein